MKYRVRKGLRNIYFELLPSVVFYDCDSEPTKWFKIKDKELYKASDIDAIYEFVKSDFDDIIKALHDEK